MIRVSLQHQTAVTLAVCVCMVSDQNNIHCGGSPREHINDDTKQSTAISMWDKPD